MTYTSSIDAFWGVLRVAIGRESLSKIAFDKRLWPEIYDIARRQGLIGILYQVVRKLPETMRPERTLWLQWTMSADWIKQQSQKADRAVAKVFVALRRDGYCALLLKGQGLSRLYPAPESRLSGDIDVWLYGNRRQIIDYVRRERPTCLPVYHHVDALIDGVSSVEVHFTPTWMYHYTTNRRLQRFFSEVAEAQFAPAKSVQIGGEEVAIPTATFNSVYLLVHLYRHWFDEGIGLRQLVDYYYVLCDRQALDLQVFLLWIKRLRLTRFLGAVCYVLHHWFGMTIEELPIAPDEVFGKQLMEGILASGNLGKFVLGGAVARQPNRMKRAWVRLRRNMTFVYAYPSEALAAPFFKLWHYLWRKWYRWT